MGDVVMVLLGTFTKEGNHLDLPDATYLESYDIEDYGGRGSAAWAQDKNKAMRFTSVAHAMRVWNTQSKTMPIRADGKPNKPLTAFTVEIKEI
jgi:hypothetical protein